MADSAVDRSEDISAKILPEHIERARFLIGYDEVSSRRQPVTMATEDNIRAFAFSYGSDNSLYAEPDYARHTRWGGVTAPGVMANVIGDALRGDPAPEAIRRAKKSLFKGIHQLHSGTSWEWRRPIAPGDKIYSFQRQESVDVKPSAFGGTSVFRVARQVRMNQRAEVVAVERSLIVLSERKTAADRGKNMVLQPARYDDETIAAIDAVYAAERVRGAEARWWEDVETGDSLGVMAKGPLTLTDIILFHTSGFALLPFGPVTGRLAYQRRLKMPAAFVKNEHGIPDIIMRMHWENDWARALGSPAAYDYGFQRECWLHHYLSDWCGDDGVVVRMHAEMRKFNYIGDTQMISGEIVGKHVDSDGAKVDVEVRFTNQRDEVTVLGTATVALPSRTHGPARYPDPQDDIAEQAKALLARHRELSPT
jgi:acyl dehydratase